MDCSKYSARRSGLWAASLALLATQGLAQQATANPPLAGLVETPPTTVETPPTAVGQPKPDSWALYWHDEFCCLDPADTAPKDRSEGGIDTSTWTFEIGNGPEKDGWGNSEPGIVTSRAANAYIHEDKALDRCVLALHAQAEEIDGHNYTSARITTMEHPVASQIEPPRDADGNYVIGGKVRVEARIKLPEGTSKGTWPAFWMLSSNPQAMWPASGEIDIMEAVQDQNYVTSGIHYGGPGKKFMESQILPHDCGNGSDCNDRYHTWALEWEIVSKNQATLKFFVDGKQQQETLTQDEWWSGIAKGKKNSDPMAPFNEPMFLVLKLAVGEEACTYACVPEPGSQEAENYSQTMYVDWIRVWQSPASAVDEPADLALARAPASETCPISQSDASGLSNSDSDSDSNGARAALPWLASLSAVASLFALLL